jgi:hypothetical protein
MGASSSTIWSDICALESDSIRARVISKVIQSPDLVAQAKIVGVYETVMTWLAAYQRGSATGFPYATVTRNMMYTTPTSAAPAPAPAPSYHRPPVTTALMVSPTAKAHDYFQESLELLGIGPDDQITQERLRAAYKRASLKAHPDKGGSKEEFDEVNRAYKYVEKILVRVNPRFSGGGSSSVTMSDIPAITITDVAAAPSYTPTAPPVKLSAKKLDMSMFNKLFEENRLPDPDRDGGYGSWMKSSDDAGAVGADPRLKGKFSATTFESVFRERVATVPADGRGRETLYAPGGVEIGGAVNNFTAAFGSDTQFTDIKEAYTTGATMFQYVADAPTDKRARSVKDMERMRAEDLARKDPAEAARFQAEVDAEAERERQRQARTATRDAMTNSWAEGLRRRLMVSDS